MATERIDIIVSERGSRTVRRNIENVGASAQRTQGAVQLLRRALATIGVGIAIRELIRLTDTFVNLQNRIRTVTDGIAELNVVTDALFEVANRTRASFEGTVEVFARTALAARDLGVSQQEVINFTESLNQAVVLSGASAEEATAALIQLSQGLASGALRGDELRSVLEQLPVVADVIAQELGVTRGQLRELGLQGKITATDILRAFRNAREELEERFAETVPTIGQSFTVLRNSVIRVIGTFNDTSGAATIISQALLSAAENVETLIRAVAALSITLGTVFAVYAIRAAIRGLIALSAAALANPFTALLLAITAATSVLISFGDQLRLTGDSGATVLDFLIVSFNALWDLVRDGVDIAVSALSGFQIGLEEIEFSQVIRNAALGFDALVGLVVGLQRATIEGFRNFPETLGFLFFQGLQNLITVAEFTVNQLVSILNRIPGVTLEAVDIPDLENPFQQAGDNLGTAFLDGFTEQLRNGRAQQAVENLIGEAEERAAQRRAEEERRRQEQLLAQRGLTEAGVAAVDPSTERNVQFQEFLRDLERETELIQLNNRERAVREALFRAEDVAKRALTEQERELIRDLVEQNDALARQEELLDKIRGPQEEYADNVAALDALLSSGRITTEEYSRAVRDLNLELLNTRTDALSGLSRGLQEAQQEFTNLADLTANTVTRSFGAAEDALTDFVANGKLSFGSLVDSILSDLSRLAVRAAIIAPLANVLGLGAGGGTATFSSLLGGIPGFNAGGSFEVGGTPGIDRNVLSLNGRPLARVSRGETVNVGRGGTGDDRPVQINFNITTPDADSFKRSQDQIFNRAFSAMERARRRNG